MMEANNETERRVEPEEHEIYHESMSVRYFLPPKRCEMCED